MMARPGWRWGAAAGLALALAGCAQTVPEFKGNVIGVHPPDWYFQGRLIPLAAGTPGADQPVTLTLSEGPQSDAPVGFRTTLAPEQVKKPFILEGQVRNLPEDKARYIQAIVGTPEHILAVSPKLPTWYLSRNSLSTLPLFAVPSPTAATVMRCGDQLISVAYADEKLRLTVGGRVHVLEQAEAASGAKFALKTDPGTSFWSKGDEGTLSLRGRNYPTCQPIIPDGVPVIAGGSKPDWSLSMTGENIHFFADKQPPLLTPTPEPIVNGPVTLYEAVGNRSAHLLSVSVQAGACQETPAHLPRPQHVTVLQNEQLYLGCGGDPLALLLGPDWQVVSLNGKPIVPNATPSLAFGDRGRLTGHTGCNRVTGAYGLGDTSLTLSRLAVTERACLPAINEQERAYLAALRQTSRFTLSPDGTLTLLAKDQPLLTARRP